MDETLAIPPGLGPEEISAVKLIADYALNNGGTGGCKAFYSPKEWRKRGEKYGRDSAFIVVHDGGALSSYNSVDWVDVLLPHLRELGFFAEPCTCWYTAVYRI